MIVLRLCVYGNALDDTTSTSTRTIKCQASLSCQPYIGGGGSIPADGGGGISAIFGGGGMPG
eukprot:1362419-Amorphochlora_amoeboformis.AAC.1